jgi:acyl carrier protein
MVPAPASATPLQPEPRSAGEIQSWLVERLSAVLGVQAAEIPLGEPLIGLGLDSMQVVVLVGELEEWLGCRFKGNPLVDYPTIESLSAYLAHQLARGNRLIDPARSEG